jgi:hypothetical protein
LFVCLLLTTCYFYLSFSFSNILKSPQHLLLHIFFTRNQPLSISPSQTVALVAASLAARDAAVFVNDRLVTPAQAAALALVSNDADRFRDEDDFDGDVRSRGVGLLCFHVSVCLGVSLFIVLFAWCGL